MPPDHVTLEKIKEILDNYAIVDVLVDEVGKFICVCGHTFSDHDHDIEMCFLCGDLWFHSFVMKPQTWFMNASFTPSLTDLSTTFPTRG